MKRFAAVALREIVERRFVLVAAAAAAVVPFLVPLLPGIPGDRGPAARSITALVLACSFGLGGSLLVGASVVGRELAERRLSFHFARPVAAPVIWGGKLAGGLALVLLAEALVLLPASAAGGAFPGLPGISLDTPVLWAILLLAVPFFLLAWVGSVALRSRSPWLVADLVLLVAVPALLYRILLRLARHDHPPEPSWAVGGGAVLVVALLAATLAQVVAGRTDPRRGHGAQSLTVWGILLVATATGAAWAERVVDPGVGRLVHAWVEPMGPGGDWVFVQGAARESGRQSRYLENLATGESRLLPFGGIATVSADGTRAVLVASFFFGPSKEIMLKTIELSGGEPRALFLSDWPSGVALAPDGKRLAVVLGGICTVYELPSLRSLASVKVPTSRWTYEPLFVAPDLVRLHPRRNSRFAPDRSVVVAKAPEDPVVAELHVSRKTLSTVATLPVSALPVRPPSAGIDLGPVYQLLPSPDLTRVLVLGFGSAHGALLVEAATGRVLASVEASGTGHAFGFFLADGRSVLSEPAPEGRRLLVLGPDGARQGAIDLPSGTRYVRFGYEPAQGLLAIGLDTDLSADKRDGYVADLVTGQLRPLQVEIPGRVWGEARSIPAPGSPATRLALEKGTGRLVLYDPETGATTPLTRGRPARK